jgi:hypothetical protein
MLQVPESVNNNQANAPVEYKKVPVGGILLIAFLGLILLSGLTVLVLKRYPRLLDIDYFLIKTVTFKGLHLVKQKQLLQVLRQNQVRHLFSLNAGALEKQMKNIPYIEAVQFNKIYPDRLLVTVTEKQVFCLVKGSQPNDKRTFLIDNKATILPFHAQVKLLFPFITLPRLGSLQKDLVRLQVRKCITIIELLREHLPGLAISEVFLADENGKKIIIYTLLEGMVILVDENLTPLQLEMLNKSLQINKSKNKNFNHFDIRFKDQVIGKKI